MSNEVFAQLRAQNRLLKLCLLAVALLAGSALLMGAVSSRGKAEFAEISVQRINIVGKDGALAMVLAGRGLLPGPIIGGKETESERGEKPGMVFFNTVGDEVGGLIYDGALDADGRASGGVHLSMDRFGGDQQLALHHYDLKGSMETGLSVFDRGLASDYEPLYKQFKDLPQGPERQALTEKWKEAGGQQVQRLFVGRTLSNSSAVVLADGEGRPKIIMMVETDGTPSLQFLDNEGEVLQSFPEATAASGG